MKKTLLLLCLAFTGIQYASAQDCNCMLELDETFSVVPMNSGTAPDYRNDDGYSSAMMLPFSLKCFTCCNYLYVGTKFNMRMETCNEDYLGIKKHRFYMKCTHCHSEITIKTDPKNHDYVCENGGSRTYEAWRDARAAE